MPPDSPLKAKARLWWEILLSTPALVTLEEAMREEKPFDALTKDERVTIGMFVARYERGLVNGTKATEEVNQAQKSEAPQAPEEPQGT